MKILNVKALRKEASQKIEKAVVSRIRKCSSCDKKKKKYS